MLFLGEFTDCFFFLSFSFLNLQKYTKTPRISQGQFWFYFSQKAALDFWPLIQIPVSPSNSNSIVFVHINKNQFSVFTLQ